MSLTLNPRVNTEVRISVRGQGVAVWRVEDIRLSAEIPDLAVFSARGEFAPRQIMLEGFALR